MPPRVVAIITTYNEERFIGGCLEHLVANGIEAYLCDNESTDRTVEIASRHLGRGLRAIETIRRDGTYRWGPLLARKEQLAAELDADWLLHLDADEIPQAPRAGQTLAEAFAEADGAGWNAIEFRELTFVATRESPDHDHPEFRRTMRWYYPFAPKPLHLVRAWKRQPAVDLVSTGGHQAKFRGRRIAPQPWFLRHYLFLSREQMLRKYEQRRYDPRELRRGWHGWRATVRADSIHLPEQVDLRFTADDGDLDASSPRRQHCVEWPARRAERDEHDANRRPVILCIVDRPAWAHDRKTDALAVALADRYRLVKRFEKDVTAQDVLGADLVLAYYWLQIDRAPEPLRRAIESRRDRLLIGSCAELELSGSMREPALGLLATLPRAVFANNVALAKLLETELGRPVFYTPNGVDTSFFRPAASAPPPTPLRVGWAGSLENHTPAHRGVFEFIAPAVASVEGAELCLAAREHHWRNAEEMRAFYQSLHVYVCASRSEGTPNPCLEAAACGLPIVTTAVGNMPELIRDGENGFLVAREAGEIAARLRRLRDDPLLRERMGAAARASIELWDWKVQAEPYAEMFKSMLEGRVPYAPPAKTGHVRAAMKRRLRRLVSRLASLWRRARVR